MLFLLFDIYTPPAGYYATGLFGVSTKLGEGHDATV